MFNNPYLYQNVAKGGLLSRLFGGSRTASLAGGTMGAARSGINWGTLLSNTQKSLGIINQAIPIVYQVKPIINNAKTMFRIAGALKDDKQINQNKNNYVNDSNNSTTIENDNKPIFYI